MQARKKQHDVFIQVKGKQPTERILLWQSHHLELKETESIFQKKIKAIHYVSTRLTGNVQGISLSGKEKSITRGKKVMKGKNFTGKSNEIAKVVSQYKG